MALPLYGCSTSWRLCFSVTRLNVANKWRVIGASLEFYVGKESYIMVEHINKATMEGIFGLCESAGKLFSLLEPGSILLLSHRD
jgi:hypothetical protein